MTREIKFRGQRLDNREWVTGNLINVGITSWINDEIEYPDNANFFKCCKRVDAATVGQYTTFKDKNGIEVYESHILTDKYGGIGVVEWQNGAFVVNFGDVDIFSIEDCFNESLQMWTIGNTHDNPELLKAE